MTDTTTTTTPVAKPSPAVIYDDRIDLLERYMQEKHNYSLDEIVFISNSLKHGEYLGDAMAAEVYKIEGTLDVMESTIKQWVEDEEEVLLETVD